MKYTIEGFNQAKLVEFNLDANDALILRWYVDFLPKMTPIICNGVEYKWVKYQAVINDIPLLRINNKNNIARRFDKFIAAGIMDKFVYKDGGNFTTFRLTQKYLELIEVSTQKDEPIYSKVDTYLLKSREGIYSKVETKDSSINNPSIKQDILSDVIDYFNIKTNKLKYQKGSERATLQKYIQTMIKNGDTLDTIKNLIDYKIANPNTQKIDLLTWLTPMYVGKNISDAESWKLSGYKLITKYNDQKTKVSNHDLSKQDYNRGAEILGHKVNNSDKPF